jgi:CarD family transcriptional regulator
MAKASNKKGSKKPVAKKAAKKTAAKKTVKKQATKKIAPKKVAAKKAVKKPMAKKTAAKKAVAKKLVKIVAKKQPAKKPVAVKQAAKQPAKAAPAHKAPQQRHHMKKEVAVFVPQSAKEQKALYKVGNFVVYPTHGVGKIMAEETQMIGDIELRLLVINFEKDKMTLRVPMQRASAAGLRPISGSDKMKEVYLSLKSKAKISRGMWSRRAQEYEAKINSGNIILISEVVRDLHQNVDQSERSYSERMIYENALNRLVGEVAAAEGTDSKSAYDKLMKLLRAKVAAAAALKEAA